MNFTIFSFILINNFNYNPLFIKNNIYLKNNKFKYFFNSILKNNFNFKISSTFFQNFLSNVCKLEKGFEFANIEGFGIQINSLCYNNSFFDSVFKDIVCTGGSILINFDGNVIIKRCGFYHCVATDSSWRAGAISCYKTNLINIINTCFYNCSSLSAVASYQIASHGGGVIYCHMNYTNDCFSGKNELISRWSSGMGANNALFNYNNNSFSYQSGDGICNFCLLPCSLTTNFGNFNQISNGFGNNLMGCYSGNGLKTLNYWNIFNNTCSNSIWFYHQSSSTIYRKSVV